MSDGCLFSRIVDGSIPSRQVHLVPRYSDAAGLSGFTGHTADLDAVRAQLRP
ncbi:MAG: hypothetical protein HY829_02215 [Actinobacteria bacterium]|nr:hypothetical protein [Actinomycetota bacterium]